MSHPVKTNRLAKSARAKNAKLVAGLADEDVGYTTFARVEANLGPKFRLVIYDLEDKRVIKVFGSPRGLFKTKKAGMQFGVNDIVLLSTSPKEGELGEIIGRIDRKEARPLYKDGRIHESVFASVDFFSASAGKDSKGAADGLDDLFDYGEPDEGGKKDEEAEEGQVVGQKAKKGDEELDIDAI
jgi:hypothetical protein